MNLLSSKEKKYFNVITGIIVIFITFLIISWLFQNPTKEELFGDTGKISDLLKGGITSWSPHFMMGGSLAINQASGLALGIVSFLISILGSLIGGFTLLKLIVLSFVIASGINMFFFVISLTKNKYHALLATLFYVTLPPILVAIGIYEHWTVGLCFVFVPLLLRGILVVAEEKSPREIVILGLAAGAISLSYTKIAVVLSPVLLLWTLEVLRHHSGNRWQIMLRYAISAGIAALTSILILLPTLREFGFAAGFLFDPLAGWQHHYSFKSALQWIDLWGVFMKGAGPNVEGDSVMFGIGLLPLVAISLGLGLPSLQEWRHSSIGRWFLVLVACWLVSTGFAAGPDGLLLGHWHILKEAQGMANSSIPLLWVALFWMAWMAYQTIHLLIGGRPWRALIILAVFLSLPFFRIVEVLPLFKDIRAPESFWSVGGFCALAAALGMATVALFMYAVPKKWVMVTGLLIGVFFFAELYPIHSSFWNRGLPSETFEQYDQALDFLKQAPLPGRVHPLSSRYFYLTIPQKTGRSLDTEALLRHFQLKWVRHLEVAGNANAEAMKSYLNLAGVSYILIDKGDPMASQQMQNFYHSFYPVVFENQLFAILENRNSLYPAFLAHNFVVSPLESYSFAPLVLQLAPMNLLSVEQAQADQTQIGFAGVIKGINQLDLLPAYQAHGGAPFQRVALTGSRGDNYQQMVYHLPPTVSGWLTISEAFHPDWTATIDGQPVKVHRAEAALLSIYVPIGSQEIIFKFIAPWWYSGTLYIGIVSWIVFLGSFFFFMSRWAPLKWKQWWLGKQK